jgi:hypothetical protein
MEEYLSWLKNSIFSPVELRVTRLKGIEFHTSERYSNLVF